MVSMDSDNLIRQLRTLEIPGLAIPQKEFSGILDALCKDIAVFLYKQKRPVIWAVFTGGTGTGKSSLFNALCSSSISKVGMERPTTGVPVAYVHKNNPLDEFPFPDFRITYMRDREDTEADETGTGKRLIVVEHDRDELEHLILVDNPDLDSLELENRQTAEDLYRLSDVIIFVTSQEKYADEIPSQTLSRLGKEGKPSFFLFNKADPANTREEIVNFFQERGIAIHHDRVWFIPYIPSPTLDMLAGQDEFSRFSASLYETLRKDTSSAFLVEQRKQRLVRLNSSIDFFFALAENENKAGHEWLQQLSILFEEKSRDLFNQFEIHFKKDSQDHIQREIRNIYNRYDILSKPRHYLKQLILAPLRLLGLREKDSDRTYRKDLLKIRKQTDVTPVLSTMSALNRLVLETFSPENHDSLFFSGLRGDEIAYSDKEVQDRIGQLQEKMIEWLEGKFSELARGIPKHKEVGIYSTAIMWGGLILSFELVLGGGITFIEMALDSFLAPLVTKGSVNLFAFHEIQNIARELDKRYKEGILVILEEQKQRYVSCLEPLMIPDETIKGLQDLKAQLGG
ncbi:MAG: 50S ribosome-binding GTPase [Deltaproteobacteria bacterium]|nr:50S ribosome-binding GTPase [Deltaproteobacteria bacterium]